MKPEVFADTNYWVALLNPRDALYEIAQSFANSIPEDNNIVTSQIVIAEALEMFAQDTSFMKSQALKFFSILTKDPRIVIETMRPHLFEETIVFYEKHTDKNWGFIDCSSFVIMKRRGIKDALTYDRHFIQAGFKALLRE